MSKSSNTLQQVIRLLLELRFVPIGQRHDVARESLNPMLLPLNYSHDQARRNGASALTHPCGGVSLEYLKSTAPCFVKLMNVSASGCEEISQCTYVYKRFQCAIQATSIKIKITMNPLYRADWTKQRAVSKTNGKRSFTSLSCSFLC